MCAPAFDVLSESAASHCSVGSTSTTSSSPTRRPSRSSVTVHVAVMAASASGAEAVSASLSRAGTRASTVRPSPVTPPSRNTSQIPQLVIHPT